MKKLTVAILFGGRSAEHEVSLQSAKNVIDSINKTKYNTVLIGISREGRWSLTALHQTE
jgi:D-alanine-D-alanine ligase